jgi:hypothetical protein
MSRITNTSLAWPDWQCGEQCVRKRYPSLKITAFGLSMKYLAGLGFGRIIALILYTFYYIVLCSTILITFSQNHLYL